MNIYMICTLSTKDCLNSTLIYILFSLNIQLQRVNQFIQIQLAWAIYSNVSWAETKRSYWETKRSYWETKQSYWETKRSYWETWYLEKFRIVSFSKVSYCLRYCQRNWVFVTSSNFLIPRFELSKVYTIRLQRYHD